MSNSSSGGASLVSLGLLVSVVFAILKLAGPLAAWTWLAVATPFLIGVGASIALVLLIALVAAVMMGVAALKARR